MNDEMKQVILLCILTVAAVLIYVLWVGQLEVVLDCLVKVTETVSLHVVEKKEGDTSA